MTFLNIEIYKIGLNVIKVSINLDISFFNPYPDIVQLLIYNTDIS